MGRPKKGEKTTGSGRAKGTPNKRTLELQEKLFTLGLSPLEELSKIMPELKPETQCHVYLSLLPYLYPKRKAIEITYDDENILTQIKSMEDLSSAEIKNLLCRVSNETS
jgi:hypothetical protein